MEGSSNTKRMGKLHSWEKGGRMYECIMGARHCTLFSI